MCVCVFVFFLMYYKFIVFSVTRYFIYYNPYWKNILANVYIL